MAFKFGNASLLSGIPWASHLPRISNFLSSGLKGKDIFWNHTILVGNRLDQCLLVTRAELLVTIKECKS